MKTWKMVAGIISCVATVIVLFQSCAAGIVGAVEKSDSVGGSAGFIVALLMLSGGITSIVTRNSISTGGDTALIVLFGLAGLIATTMNGVYSDLIIWGIWCLVNAGLAFKSRMTKAKA